MMRPVALGILLLTFIYTFKVFDLIYIMTRGGPVDATTVLPIYTFKLTFDFFRFGDGAAAATLLLLGLLSLAIGYSRLIRTRKPPEELMLRRSRFWQGYPKTLIAALSCSSICFRCTGWSLRV